MPALAQWRERLLCMLMTEIYDRRALWSFEAAIVQSRDCFAAAAPAMVCKAAQKAVHLRL